MARLVGSGQGLLEVNGEGKLPVLDVSKMTEEHHAIRGEAPDIDIVAAVDSGDVPKASPPWGNSLNPSLIRSMDYLIRTLEHLG